MTKYVFSKIPADRSSRTGSLDYTVPLNMSRVESNQSGDTFDLPPETTLKYQPYTRTDFRAAGKFITDKPMTRIENYPGHKYREVQLYNFPPTGGWHGELDHEGKYNPPNLPDLVRQVQQELGWTPTDEVKQILGLT